MYGKFIKNCICLSYLWIFIVEKFEHDDQHQITSRMKVIENLGLIKHNGRSWGLGLFAEENKMR